MTGTRRYRGASRGFSLLEMVLVVAIIGLMGAIALPAFQRLRESSEVNGHIRLLISDISRARQEATSGRVYTDGGGNQGTVRFAGLRVLSTTSYAIFATDAPGSPAGEEIVKAVQFRDAVPLRIEDGAALGRLLFRANGTLDPTSDFTTIAVQDLSSGRRLTLTVSLTGAVTRS